MSERQSLARLGCQFVITLSRTTAAEYFSFAANFTAKINPFATNFANNALPFVSGEFFWRKFNSHPLRRELVVI